MLTAKKDLFSRKVEELHNPARKMGKTMEREKLYQSL